MTYREAAILIDEKESSLASRQRVAQVVAHELSHQWVAGIGNRNRFVRQRASLKAGGCVVHAVSKSSVRPP